MRHSTPPLIAALATSLAAYQLPAAAQLVAPATSQKLVEPEMKAPYQPSELARALFALDSDSKDFDTSVELARKHIALAIEGTKLSLEKLPPESSFDTRLRALHSAVHEVFGWGIENQPSFVKGIAEKQPDCDVFCLIYHEVGRAVGIPLRVVETIRDDGRNHAFITAGDGQTFRAVETRARPNTAQILHLSECELVRQYERAHGLPLDSTPMLLVEKNEMVALALFERRGVVPAEFVGGAQELDRLIHKALTPAMRSDRTTPHRVMFDQAIASGLLTESETASLTAVRDYRSRVAAELSTLMPEHPFVLGWTQGTQKAQERYDIMSKDIAARGASVRSELAQIENFAGKINAEFTRTLHPFEASRGQFDDEGQDTAPFRITIFSTESKKGIAVAGLSGVQLLKSDSGEKSVVVTYRDGPEKTERRIEFTAKGEIRAVK